jgi:hypothetical protein
VTHRFRALEELESELSRAITRAPGAPARGRIRVGRGRRGLGLVVLAAVLLVGGAAIGLAASGVLLPGAAVQTPPSASPVAGAGLPLPGQSKMLPPRVPDPGGGPDWGMRAVQTTRGLVCVQIGRVQNGELGELGIDGAFGNDGLFHPVGPGVLPTYTGGAAGGGVLSERGSCVLAYGDVTGNGEAWGSAVAAEFSGADENAAFATPARQSVAPPHRRRILYGILGPHAVSVTYRAESGDLHVVPVVPGIGAYLIVLPDSGSGPEGRGEAPGTDTPGEGPGTSGSLVLVTYEDHGKVCENGYNAQTGGSAAVKHACPPANPYPPSLRVTPPGSFVHAPQVSLDVSGNRVTGATFSFAAPFAVTSAAEGYSLSSEACGPRAEGVHVAVLDRNVAAGEPVSLKLEHPFSDPCARRGLRVNVIYQSAGPNAKHSYGRAPGELVVGTATIRLPAGDVPG